MWCGQDIGHECTLPVHLGIVKTVALLAQPCETVKKNKKV